MAINERVGRSPESPDATIRASYRTAISSISPLDELEARDISETLDWLKTSPEIHKPLNMDRHLGVLVLLLSADRESTFLMNHRKAQRWLPPGGHVDSGQTFPQAVAQEMQEELDSGIDFITPSPFMLTQTLTGGLNAGHVDVTTWFLGEGDSSRNYPIQEKEASEGRWFRLSDIAQDPSQKHLARAVTKIQGLQLRSRS